MNSKFLLRVRRSTYPETIWTEVIMANFKVLSRHYLEGLMKTTGSLSQDCLSPGRDLNLGADDGELTILSSCHSLY